MKQQHLKSSQSIKESKNNLVLSELDQYDKGSEELNLTSNTAQNLQILLANLFQFQKLKKLNLSYNNLDSMNIDIPQQLTDLILNNNVLKTINPNMNNLKNLVYLDISHNLISNISPLKQFLNLKYLFLKNNRIQQISLLQQHLTQLIELDISQNQISDFNEIKQFENHKQLMILNAKENPYFKQLQLQQTILSQNKQSYFILQNLPILISDIYCKNQNFVLKSKIFKMLSESQFNEMKPIPDLKTLNKFINYAETERTITQSSSSSQSNHPINNNHSGNNNYSSSQRISTETNIINNNNDQFIFHNKNNQQQQQSPQIKTDRSLSPQNIFKQNNQNQQSQLLQQQEKQENQFLIQGKYHNQQQMLREQIKKQKQQQQQSSHHQFSVNQFQNFQNEIFNQSQTHNSINLQNSGKQQNINTKSPDLQKKRGKSNEIQNCLSPKNLNFNLTQKYKNNQFSSQKSSQNSTPKQQRYDHSLTKTSQTSQNKLGPQKLLNQIDNEIQSLSINIYNQENDKKKNNFNQMINDDDNDNNFNEQQQQVQLVQDYQNLKKQNKELIEKLSLYEKQIQNIVLVKTDIENLRKQNTIYQTEKSQFEQKYREKQQQMLLLKQQNQEQNKLIINLHSAICDENQSNKQNIQNSQQQQQNIQELTNKILQKYESKCISVEQLKTSFQNCFEKAILVFKLKFHNFDSDTHVKIFRLQSKIQQMQHKMDILVNSYKQRLEIFNKQQQQLNGFSNLSMTSDSQIRKTACFQSGFNTLTSSFVNNNNFNEQEQNSFQDQQENLQMAKSEYYDSESSTGNQFYKRHHEENDKNFMNNLSQLNTSDGSDKKQRNNQNCSINNKNISQEKIYVMKKKIKRLESELDQYKQENFNLKSELYAIYQNEEIQNNNNYDNSNSEYQKNLYQIQEEDSQSESVRNSCDINQ